MTHDLCHLFASALFSGCASVEQGQLVLGHACAVVMPRIRVHLWPGEEDRTRSAMDAVLGGLRTGCGEGDPATKEIAGQGGMIQDQAFLVSQKILSIWAM